MAYESKRARIEREMREALDQGIYSPGDRLPSARDLALRHHASLATAQAAMFALRDAGLIEGRPGDGYYLPESSEPPRLSPETRLKDLEAEVAQLREQQATTQAWVFDLYDKIGQPRPGAGDTVKRDRRRSG